MLVPRRWMAIAAPGELVIVALIQDQADHVLSAPQRDLALMPVNAGLPALVMVMTPSLTVTPSVRSELERSTVTLEESQVTSLRRSSGCPSASFAPLFTSVEKRSATFDVVPEDAQRRY